MMKRTAIFTKASSETFRFPGPPRKLPFSTHSAQNKKKKEINCPTQLLMKNLFRWKLISGFSHSRRLFVLALLR